MKKLILLLLPFTILLFAFHLTKNITVTGTITDGKGQAITAATISEKGTKNSVASNATGRYSIEVQGRNAEIIFSVVGYKSVTVKVSGRTVINVSLSAASDSLQEVIVTSTELKKSKRVTYSDRSSNELSGSVAGITIQGYTPRTNQQYNTEDYDGITENGFHKVNDDPLSTFSIDVDAASYSNIRRFLNEGELPPAGAVRVEEMINYFKYNYPAPMGDHPFSINTELSDCPWNSKHKLVLIGLQGTKIPVENLPPSNLVFLIDVSGSMSGENRLPLVKSSLKLLVDQLREEDKISIVVYAGAAGLVLPPTSGNDKIKIKTAIDDLSSGGSTAGGEGIKLAYKTARENFIKKGNNRIILCTDGDFNVGVSSDAELERLAEKEREGGVFLTVLGYGMGNYKDNKLQKLADKGNGNHAYIDGLNEAKKVLVSEFGGTLFTIAKDVKLQVEFNPAKVAGYRLVGYENRMLQKEDFNDDKKDAGELGSGHTVTALYEIIPAGVKSDFLKSVDPLKYSNKTKPATSGGDELLTVKFRYKEPVGDKSSLIAHPVTDQHTTFSQTSDNFRFAASVAGFGLLLRNSEFRGTASYNQLIQLATGAKGTDEEGYRKEAIALMKKAASLSKEQAGNGDVSVNDEE